MYLTNAANSFTNQDLLYNGTVSISNIANGGLPSALGASTNAVTNLELFGGVLQYTGPAVSTNRGFSFGAATSTVSAGLDASGTGPLAISGLFSNFVNSTSASASVLTLTGSNTGANVLSNAVLADGTNTHSVAQTLAITKTGLGQWVLGGPSTYSGATSVNGGTLVLDMNSVADYGSTAGGALNSVSALNLGGGVFQINGVAGAASSQTLGALTLATLTENGIALSTNSASGSGLALTLSNAWSRAAGSTLNINLAGASAPTLVSSPTLTSGILPYATVTDSTATGFAAVSSGDVVRYIGATTPLPASSSSSTTNYLSTATDSGYSSGTLPITAGETVNSLQLDTSNGSGTVDLGTHTLSVSGLLVTGTNSANNYTIKNGQVGAAGGELIVHQFAAGTLTVSGTIGSSSTRLTKDGPGTLVISGTNAYTSTTVLNQGTTFVTGSIASTFGTFVNAGATVGGTGSVGPLTVNAGGIVAPGVNAIGTVNTGALALTGIYNAEINPNTNGASDLINVTGTVNLTGSTLNLSLIGTPATGPNTNTYVLIQNDGTDAVTGTFAHINPQNAGNFLYTINYAYNADGGSVGNDVAITFSSVPEPGGAGLILSAGFAFAARRRRRFGSV